MASTAVRPDPHEPYGNIIAFSLPVAGSLALHALVLAILFWSWQRHAPPLTVAPKVIQAHLVKLTAEAPVSKPAQAPPPEPAAPVKPVTHDIAPKEVPKPAIKPPPPKPDLQKLNAEKAHQKLLEEKQAQEKLEKQKQEEAAKLAQAKAAEARKQADEALAHDIANENAQQAAKADEALAESFYDKIRERVEQYWNRPPNRRKGMAVLLEIDLVPTGYVTAVTIVESSGNEAFDLSAEQAVRRAEYFPVVKEMPPRVFEDHFRHFQMRFRIDDDL